MQFKDAIAAIGDDRPVLIAGPTASGKSALALAIAEACGGAIVNADALQVYDRWRILTARPDKGDLARAPHRLYGHIGKDVDYSVGHWCREVADLLAGPERAIIVGGTGLYFTALTDGLVDIPPTPPAIRKRADALSLPTLLDALDLATRDTTDVANRARVQRAWEVLQTTGRGLSAWQKLTPPPALPPEHAHRFVLDAPPDRLNPLIERRFDDMLARDVLDEVRAALPDYDPSRPADRAIGAPELVAYLRDDMPLAQARDRAIVATRQYAKRQRTWFGKRMKDWNLITV